MGSAIGQVETDGVRYAAYESDTQTTRVIDTQSRTSFDVGTPPGCANTNAGAYGLVSVGGGQLLWKCSDFTAMLLDLETRSLHAPAPIAGPSFLGYFEAARVGAYWVELWHEDSIARRSLSYAANWRTGAMVWVPGSKTRAVDLDSPDLTVRMCDPLRRSILESGLGGETPRQYDRYDYEPPYGMRMRDSNLVLERCGKRRKVLARGGLFDFQLAGGVATWTAGKFFNAYVPSTGARTSLRPTGRGPITRTLTRVYQSVFRGYSMATRTYTYEIQRAAWKPKRTSR